MNLIPYEQFTIDGNVLKKLQEHYTNRKIKEYFKNHGVMPNSGTVESFVIPPELMDEYKMYYYSEYQRIAIEDAAENEGENSRVISFGFSVKDEEPLILGAGNDNGQYQYEYWNIAIYESGVRHGKYFGSFDSLSGVTVKLNSLKKYDVVVYHRKSNYQYEQTSDGIPINNTFYHLDHNLLSNYSPFISGNVIEYQTQLEDKEYIGVITGYEPQDNGVIRGNVYTLNPQMLVRISGLTSGMSVSQYWGIREAALSANTNGVESNIGFSGDDSTIMFLLTKDYVLYALGSYGILWEIDNGKLIDKRTFPIPTNTPYVEVHFPNGNVEYIKPTNTIVNDEWLLRNETITLTYYIPPQGEDIDTGFDFDVIDDGEDGDGTNNEWLRISKYSGYTENSTTENITLSWDTNTGRTRMSYLEYHLYLYSDFGDLGYHNQLVFDQQGESELKLVPMNEYTGDDGSIPTEFYEELMEKRESGKTDMITISATTLPKQAGTEIMTINVPCVSGYTKWSIELIAPIDWTSYISDYDDEPTIEPDIEPDSGTTIYSGNTPYGSWIADKVEVETGITINGNTSSVTSTTLFEGENCRLVLDALNKATLWVYNSNDKKSFTYDNATQRITFREALNATDNGKTISLLGIYDVIFDGDTMILHQPEATVMGGQATYYFHRS